MSLSKKEERILIAGLSYAIDSLITDSPGLGWTEIEKQYGNSLRKAKRIPATCRMIQDRFAMFCSECRLSLDEVDEIRNMAFDKWLNWSSFSTIK